VLDRPFSLLLLLAIAPLIGLNVLLALISRKAIFIQQRKTDALGRAITLRQFSRGWYRNSARLFDILKGTVGFCGVSLNHSLPPYIQQAFKRQYECKAGLCSLFDLHQQTGLAVHNSQQLLQQQLVANLTSCLLLLLRTVVIKCLYKTEKNVLTNCATLPLFGLKISNPLMQQAVDWVILRDQQVSTKIGFFVNAHSINLSLSQPAFHASLAQADILFADGSGVRMAANHAGYQLQENINGTDMLPHLCEACLTQGKSLYFLGAQQGIAAKAAENLSLQFPGLNIAGSHHGFFQPEHLEAVISSINASHCDILLVAMGSPYQEQWLLSLRQRLDCHTALAVGGLFDFYSGQLSRAPLWLRELGLEWIWRLLQEPISKFKRYMIGNPLFLFRVFILGLATKGVK
jgi:beta-1,4-glucosyltransferase